MSRWPKDFSRIFSRDDHDRKLFAKSFLGRFARREAIPIHNPALAVLLDEIGFFHFNSDHTAYSGLFGRRLPGRKKGSVLSTPTPGRAQTIRLSAGTSSKEIIAASFTRVKFRSRERSVVLAAIVAAVDFADGIY